MRAHADQATVEALHAIDVKRAPERARIAHRSWVEREVYFADRGEAMPSKVTTHRGSKRRPSSET